MTYAIAPVQTVAPTELPVSLLEAKAHLRVDGTEEDLLIAALIDAAVSHLDGWSGILGRCLMTQTWRQDLDGFSTHMRLPFPNVQSVTVAYSDTSNAAQTWASTNYNLVNRVDGAWVELSSTGSWPDTYERPDAVRITMVCGYTSVPDGLKAAILLHIGALFEQRSSLSEKPLMPVAYDMLVGKYRAVGV